jgi:hypothetical protein
MYRDKLGEPEGCTAGQATNAFDQNPETEIKFGGTYLDNGAYKIKCVISPLLFINMDLQSVRFFSNNLFFHKVSFVCWFRENIYLVPCI